jgi:hypothetical protein
MANLIYKIRNNLKQIEDFLDTTKKVMGTYKETVESAEEFIGYVKRNGSTVTKGFGNDVYGALDDLGKSFAGALDSFSRSFGGAVDKFGKSVGGAVSGVVNDFQKNITISPTILKPFKAYNPGNGKGYGHGAAKASGTGPGPMPRPASSPAPAPTPRAAPEPAQSPAETYQSAEKASAEPVTKQKPVEKQTTLDEIVNEFKGKLKQFNTGYDANIDVYDKGSVIRSYEPVVQKEKIVAQEKPKIAEQISISDQKYLEDSISISDMYNKGYNTTWIINESAKRGYEGVRNRTDITDRVALSLDAGFAYTRGKYDSTIATKLGAKEQIINDYLSGKSYKEIKENLKGKTNGMTISDSSILRTLHKYEKQSRKKIVGKRNGKVISKKK